MENDHYESVACRKQHGSHSDYICTSEFIQQLQENPGMEMLALAFGMFVAISAQNMALNENISYQLKCKDQFPTEKVRVKPHKGKYITEQFEKAC